VIGLLCVLVLCIGSNVARADVIDDIVYRTDAKGEIDAVIKFTVPIQRLRYAQQNQSSTFLLVYFSLFDNVALDQLQDFEVHRSPPTDLVPRFNVTLRDLTLNPKAEIQFDQPAEYALKAGRDGRSLVLHIKPALAQQDRESPPIAAVPAVITTPNVPLPTVVMPAIPVANPVNLPSISPEKSTVSSSGSSIIDDIALRSDSKGVIEGVIRFNTSIQNLRFVQQKQSSTTSLLYFNIDNAVASGLWRDSETQQSPAADGVPLFTVTTHDLNQKPRIEIQFERAAEYGLKAGKDGRSLILIIKADLAKQDKVSKTVSVLPALVAAPIVTAAATLASTATPNVATPIVVLASSPVTEPPTVSSVVTPPVAVRSIPALPSITQSAAVGRKVDGRLGGKDGLPTFPVIDEQGVIDKATVNESLTLAEQIMRANNQAALLMVTGRDAILSGEMFTAIDAFNNVLKLPSNKYSQDAQVWIGIAREKSGQPYKALSEYETYLKLYPVGTAAMWVKDRQAKLGAVLPALPTQQTAMAKAPRTDFKNMEYGSLSTYYYRGASHTNTVTNVGATQVPTSLNRTDQSTLLTNVMVTDRFYNNEFDNRIVFQGFNAANFLPQQPSRQQLNALYVDVRNRMDDYSVRLGRQSPYGGGVMGRFDGATAGYGVTPDARVNVVAGQLADAVIGAKPKFLGLGVDLGVKDAFGGSLYVIKQTVAGLTDRQAIGGNMRYFEHGSTVMGMLDYDTQFRAVNWATVQGTLHTDSETDYNMLLDRRRSPVLDLRNSVMGTTNSVDVLLQNGFTQSDLITLAKQRTATSNMAMVGVNKRIAEKWQAGSDIAISSISGLPQSGTLINGVQVGSSLVGGTPGLEGFIPATPSTGSAWTLSGRLVGNDFISSHDISIVSLSYTKSKQMTGEMLLLTNHAFLQENLTLDSTLRVYLQSDSFGGKQSVIAPVFKLGFRLKNNLSLDTEAGIESTKSTPSALQSSKTNRQYFSFGFRWDF
jgi:hypothetical protein